MFNKKDSHGEAEAPRPSPEVPVRREASAASRAVIGASIHVEGTLRGNEDLIIEGKVNGTVELKQNSVTIGAEGEVKADVYAHTIFVDGSMEGNLVAAERIVIRKSARVRGSIAAPRVSLEDGARFNGSIDMDPESDALAKAFSKRADARPSTTPAATGTGKQDLKSQSTGSA
ncbi:MAG: polymer-forming cytoskeletal protein [Wenzhouxiangella sp.]|nr:polymer-forming cytoskeletal protein [Wenzhouxiangella sp.]MCH8477779.1 polymer-forming cytoskeletal protein [Wenzhouxiangella sp.]